MSFFRRRPRPAEVVAEAQLDYRDAVIEGLRDALAEANARADEAEQRTAELTQVLGAQIPYAMAAGLQRYMAEGLRARRRLNDHTTVLRRSR